MPTTIHATTCDCAATVPPHRWSDEVTDGAIAAARSIGILTPDACRESSGIVMAGNPGDPTLWIRLRSEEEAWPVFGRIDAAHPGCFLRGMCNETAPTAEAAQ